MILWSYTYRCFLRAKAEDTNPDMEEKEKVKNEDFKKREKKDKS